MAASTIAPVAMRMQSVSPSAHPSKRGIAERLRDSTQVYENSPNTAFIGLTLHQGFVPILNLCRASYPTRTKMGPRTYSDLEVRLLLSSCGVSQVAVVTGKFHLARTGHRSAADDDGIFSLVWRKKSADWKIVHDHTN